MNNIFRGWHYISALFTYFCQIYGLNRHDSHVSPRFIYRGISKRFFTESQSINKIDDNLAESIEIPENETNISSNVKRCYRKAIDDFDRISDRCKDDTERDVLKKKCIYDRLYQELLRKIYSKPGCTEQQIFKLKAQIDKLNAPMGVCLDEEVLRLQINLNYLKKVNKYLQEYMVSPELIRSGASVRLRDTSKDYSTIADYLSYIRNLIDGFKLVNPDFRQFNELEILAEIQHRGGGSCLVDFSNDFLISLWFATNNNFNDVGYLFCYDINADALEEDNLTYLTKDRSTISIEQILRKTRKSTRYTGDDKHRFWLWRPANINGRIARQDSVFVFGIEKFELDKHPVKIIPIPPSWKEEINKALKVYFGTTAEVVFPDIDGYANANSKVEKLQFQTQYFDTFGCPIKNPEYIQKGMSCLLHGDYQLSLDYFQKWLAGDVLVHSATSPQKKGESDNSALRKIHIEVYYSIGFCYRRLGKAYSAAEYLHEAFIRCYNVLSSSEIDNNFSVINSYDSLKGSLDNLDEVQFSTKLYKIVEDYIEVLSDLKRHETIIRLVDLLLTSFSRKADTKSKIEVLTSIRNNAVLLHCLHRSSLDGGRESRFCKLIPSSVKSDSFHYILKLFFSFVKSCYDNPSDVPPNELNKSLVCKNYNALRKAIKEKILYGAIATNTNWNFSYIRDAIAEYWDGDESALSCFRLIIAELEDLQNILQTNKNV